jgi:enterochelin esterase family protein
MEVRVLGHALILTPGIIGVVLFRLADPGERYLDVHLRSDLPLEQGRQALARRNGEWRLRLDLPAVSRLEYQFEVRDHDGGTEYLCDPDNPKRAPGAFGEKSVLLAPGYTPPAWLEAEPATGRRRDLVVRGRGLGAEVHLQVWSPDSAAEDHPLPLLVAHDGPEYDALARLTRFAAAAIAAGALPPLRIALLAPGDRDEWYSASARYAAALVRDVLPAIGAATSVRGAPVGMGASLGALAMLHAQRRYPDAFGGLFLQSGSYFVPRFDAHESGFGRYQRVVRAVSGILHAGPFPAPVPVTLTCGAAEENAHNNRLMARALAVQGYDVTLEELTDTHNYTAWRDGFDPHLTRLLAAAW